LQKQNASIEGLSQLKSV